MPSQSLAPLVHLLGFLSGAALYAMLFGLVARRRGSQEAEVHDKLPLVTSILGLTWNLSGLAAYGIRDLAAREPPAALVALAYAALGFLPAVAVHSVLRADDRKRTAGMAGAFIFCAYAISAIAGVLMFAGLGSGQVPSRLALQTLTWSYAALIAPILLLTRRRPGSGRAWSILALALFAVSALHLSNHQGGQESWFVEVVGHHASIPLIFTILYQDFRFALADLFLKRALTLIVLMAVAAGLYFGVAVPTLARHDFRSDVVAVGTMLVLWAGTAILYPALRQGAAWAVDRLVLRRADYRKLRIELADRIESAGTAEGILGTLSDMLAPALSSPEVTWEEVAASRSEVQAPGRISAVIPIVTAEYPRYELLIGPLRGGRRLLSDDVHLLNDVAIAAARRIDVIRLGSERVERAAREEEMKRLAAEAELRALRAQMNPHFLFNALNTIGFLIRASPVRAHATLMKLTALLRSVLRSSGSWTTLGEEMDLVRAYLEIEQARFEERLQVVVDVPEELQLLRIPPLVVQPLVENAIKHGIAGNRRGGKVSVSAHLDPGDGGGENLVLIVRNTGSTPSAVEIARGRMGGVGLQNIERRLRHHHGESARLTLSSLGAGGTIAEVVIPLAAEAVAEAHVVARGA
ncbi:MAG TPA: histidine kinase [Thermoanaerobaculia bacterium]|nr:histidine kinase [Thermoanaerobaculia bacterium]